MEAAEAGHDGLPAEGAAKHDSDSDESVDLEVESNASETTVSCHGFVLVTHRSCRLQAADSFHVHLNFEYFGGKSSHTLTLNTSVGNHHTP